MTVPVGTSDRDQTTIGKMDCGGCHSSAPGKGQLPPGTKVKSDGHICSESHAGLTPRQSAEARAWPCMSPQLPQLPSLAKQHASRAEQSVLLSVCGERAKHHPSTSHEQSRACCYLTIPMNKHHTDIRNKSDDWHQFPNLRHHVGGDGVTREDEG